ncbi:MAG: CxxC motif-containing protein (DUF1111 family) [Arcticibacterium sp.]|jgi:CxxC motif-containing protein (DUF1111 family)
MMKRIILLIFLTVSFGSCDPTGEMNPRGQYEANEEFAGGDLTTFDFGENAFGHSASNLSFEEENSFVVGNSFFRSNWTIAPASASVRDGLGPIFNSRSCGGCHPKDGRSAPPSIFGDPLNGLLVRLSGINGFAHDIYGGQLQDKAILGALPEAKVGVRYTEVVGEYADGGIFSLRDPEYIFSEWGYGEIESGFLFSPRIGNQLAGIGLLEAIREEDILSNVDINDSNGDGISGKANFVFDELSNSVQLGRFGWKSNQPSLLQQTAGAFNGDIGITSSVFMKDHVTDAQVVLKETPNGGEPEISDKNLEDVVFYLQTLQVPGRRDTKNEDVLSGKLLFTELNCSSCHIPEFKTGKKHEVSILNNQTIRPYSDLLLHDMGPALADNRPDFEATGNEWRTPPLWGLGMIRTVNKHTFLLHDGRARNIEEAILWHGGEAESSKERFIKLSSIDRDMLIKFLESL